MPTTAKKSGTIMTENRNYWAEVAAQREDERRLRAIDKIPLEDLERFARFYWAAQSIDYFVNE